ncbi:phosphatase PAP2 family protein [Chroococcus sp. FPU101]|uniref:phosphatase PAP2 family protein n=1 Tax=Chroococcus sp. FPU101 TaxID=1974212 RepID=UPI001A907E47|nr:phosphatase PAP2 family protein [Chroococcus sp. FPU101]GFE70714.1 phosphoesterase PA-phosphatase related [Chroococcus sp. FPU101]
MTTEVDLSPSPEPKQFSIFLFFIGVYLPLQIFALLAFSILQNGTSLSWDVSLLSAIHQTETPQLDAFASILTQFGYLKGIAPIVFLVSLLLILRQQWHRLAYLLTVEFGAILISYSVKLVYHRARPHLWELFQPLPLDYSFPSGHSLMSMILFVALLHLSWETRWYKWVMLIGGLYVVSVGWTRMYLGVHFPSDVLGGWMLAIAWGVGVNLIFHSPFAKLIARKQEIL